MANNRILFAYCKRFAQWEETLDPEYFLHRKQIEEFYKVNKMSIDFMNLNIERQNKEFFMYDGAVMKIANGSGIFKDESKKADYAKELNEIFDKPVKITINGYQI